MREARCKAMATGAPPYPKMPVIETMQAIMVLIINILLPGIGTIVAGVLGGTKLIGRGIAQFFLALIIVGWVWGIVNGIQAIANAKWKEGQSQSA